jgi:ferredoxin
MNTEDEEAESPAPEVDLSACNRCLACVAACPDVFSENEAGYIEVAEMDEYPEDCVREAVKYCPERCIRWKDQ